ncbi:MAG TPA: hypothetical protein ENK56_10010 [Chloroflexi bacterium]|nr:hypothetical protein [Chloroflexota bacterium]
MNERNSSQGKKRRIPLKTWIILAVVVALILLVLGVIFLLGHPETTATIRDLFIIVLAVESLIILTLLAILVYQLWTLIRMLREEVRPILRTTNETLNTVKGTTEFVSRQVTSPAITAASYAAGARRSLQVLIRLAPRRK